MFVSRLKTEIEVVHAKLCTDVKTLGEEVLSDIQKKHDLWEQKLGKIELIGISVNNLNVETKFFGRTNVYKSII